MNKYLLGLLLLAPGLAMAQAATPFVIKGKVGQLNAPAKIYLVYGPQVLDSATLKNGTFEIKGTTDWPRSAALVLTRKGRLGDNSAGQAYFQAPDRSFLFLEPSPIVVTSADSLTRARITGGPQTAAYQRLQSALKPVTKKIKIAGAKKTTSKENLPLLIRSLHKLGLLLLKLTQQLGPVWSYLSN
jgi:hypothetical protein